jgi:hypothetical protein
MQISRKGIYQEFDRAGTPLTDERWQAITLPDGSIYVENETVRRAPWPEPRSDSMTLILDRDLRLTEFSIFGLFAKRESRICLLNESRSEASICWRFGGSVNERKVTWRDELEIDWQTPLLNMATIWRGKLEPGQSRMFDCWYLDPVSFAPRLMRQTYANHGPETIDTHFGPQTLTRYTLDFGATGAAMSTLWCDDDGVIFEFQTQDGGWRLLAANV